MSIEKSFSVSSAFAVYKKDNGRFVGALLDKGILLELDSRILSKLISIDTGSSFTFQDFMSSCDFCGPDKAKSLFDILRDVNVIIPFEGSVSKESSSTLNWEENGWLVAKIFHSSVIYTEFLTGDENGWKYQLEAMSRINSSGIIPNVVKDYSKNDSIDLLIPAEFTNVNFFDVLDSRCTIRSFKRKSPITLRLVSDILYHSSRARAVHQTKYFGEVMRKASPSGGSLHPVEIYPQILSVDGIKDGSCYYNPLEHSLKYISNELNKEFLFELSQRQVDLEGNFLAFIVTARFSRNFWKYRYSKSYAFTLFDVGHFVQTLILTCEAFGLKCFLTPALDLKLAQQHLNLKDMYEECPEYLIIAG